MKYKKKVIETKDKGIEENYYSTVLATVPRSIMTVVGLKFPV
jgi:hypothetical protein